MRVVLTNEALADLRDIADYIAQDSPSRALTFVEELVLAARQLEDVPLGFPLLQGYESFGVRRKPYRAYSIFYRIQHDRTDILHILHGSQDYESVLFPDG